MVHMVRHFAAVLALVAALAACSDSDSGQDADDEPGSSESAALSASAKSACDLLTREQLEDLAGGPVGSSQTSLVGSLPACRWLIENGGGFIQVGSLSSPDWAQGLPDLMRTLEAAGALNEDADPETVRRFRDLVSSAQSVGPTEACDAFSAMLELQGDAPGTTMAVTAFPSKERPQALSGQICSAGRFTTVTLAVETGLDEPFPVKKVTSLVRAAHAASLN